MWFTRKAGQLQMHWRRLGFGLLESKDSKSHATHQCFCTRLIMTYNLSNIQSISYQISFKWADKPVWSFMYLFFCRFPLENCSERPGLRWRVDPFRRSMFQHDGAIAIRKTQLEGYTFKPKHPPNHRVPGLFFFCVLENPLKPKGFFWSSSFTHILWNLPNLLVELPWCVACFTPTFRVVASAMYSKEDLPLPFKQHLMHNR